MLRGARLDSAYDRVPRKVRPLVAAVSTTYHLLRLAGYLDIGRYPEFREAFESVPPHVPILVDLQDAVGVDSVFLSELLLFKRRRRPSPVAVVISPAGRLAKVFEIANIGTKLNVFDDVSAAVGALGLVEVASEPSPAEESAGE